MLTRLVLATHNPGKTREFAALLKPYGLELLSAGELGLTPPPETGTTFAANARLKARYVAEAAQLPALADDSGLCAAALDGAPGVYSADWGVDGNFTAAMARLTAEIAARDTAKQPASRAAAFVTVLAFAQPGEEDMLLAEGRVDGTLVFPPRGLEGFGYDPCFMPQDETRTFGEMALAEKQLYSHRARAVTNLAQKLAGRGWLAAA